MEHDEIIKFILDEPKRRNISRESLKRKANASIGHFGSVLKRAHTTTGHGSATVARKTIGLRSIIALLDAMDLQLVIEDKSANWGEEMERLRRMPEKLFVAERIESREIVKKEGFYPRVDLFDNIDSIFMFVPKPCDVYEIHIGKLIRKKFDIVNHPSGTMYSYNEWIAPESIKNMVTYR